MLPGPLACGCSPEFDFSAGLHREALPSTSNRIPKDDPFYNSNITRIHRPWTTNRRPFVLVIASVRGSGVLGLWFGNRAVSIASTRMVQDSCFITKYPCWCGSS